MTRTQRHYLFLAMGIVGSIGIGLSVIPIFRRFHGAVPDMLLIVAGTLLVSFAMMWACFFAVRAHLSQDEFKRQREIMSGYWGGWLGIAASAPVYFFTAAGGFGHPLHAPPVISFTFGYVLAPIFGAVGTIGTRMWLHGRDRQVAQ